MIYCTITLNRVKQYFRIDSLFFAALPVSSTFDLPKSDLQIPHIFSCTQIHCDGLYRIEESGKTIFWISSPKIRLFLLEWLCRQREFASDEMKLAMRPFMMYCIGRHAIDLADRWSWIDVFKWKAIGKNLCGNVSLREVAAIWPKNVRSRLANKRTPRP